MSDPIDDTDSDDLYDEPASALARWVPVVVVVGFVVGFTTLAWYAYHAGTQSLKEEDLLVVEADKTPMKEKPADPGGMKFPNQDKTIFETFANGAPPPSKVERVLPPPEEPLPKQADTSDTTSWVNKDADKPAAPVAVTPPAPAVVAPSAAPEAPKVDAEIKKDIAPVAVKPAPEKAIIADNNVTSYSAVPKPAPAAAPAAKVETPKAEAPKKAEAKVAATGTEKIQLGAYRSEKEASDAWNAMQKKYVELANRTPLIIKADLGEKGIYYRLRVSGFASAAEAKKFCASLSAKGHACLVP